ncbi:MAG: translation initiation factor IF-2 [Gracilimonas sp.]|uniref:translation initiation factor IF-2 n=1 Tax=Gracilimonas TaxID=649462 RepID=UPI001B29EF10|nr:translation initiation factor IF-2 [Gracilimonas sp.]MBO6586289.1 translation initiation factor IF-2 [Gracilimonas sp.]MBO6614946.1 translation initiation factor IF-2 [Gracilimonas sp.]
MSKRPKPLFKVASEFNVSTQSIVDTLSEDGFDVANRPNFKITPEMYEALDEVYGEDRAKSADHEKAREEYESRRSQMMNQRNDSVTLDNVLEPIEDEVGLEPEDDDTEDLEPQDDESGDELDLEPIEEEDEADEQAEEEAEAKKKAEAEAKAKKEEEEAEAKKKEEAEAKKKAEAEAKAKKEEEEAEKAEKKEAEAEAKESEKVEGKDDEDDEEDEDTESKKSEDDEDEEDEDVIRGSAGKLKGTKVLGKASFTTERKPRKKRKRRKDRKDDSSSSKSDSDNKSKKSRKKRKKKTEIDETDVDKMMRETMKKMQSSKTVGSKRQKRRRERKEEREEELQKQAELEELESDVVETTEFITANELADLLGVGVNDIISVCMSIGLMITINQRLDAGTIELVAEEYGKEVKFIEAEEMDEDLTIPEDEEEDLKPRAPIITVMGHVDHGKTSLLDYIREEKVAAGEAGGITQHVGAYQVVHNDNEITFLDTPGHEAFTAMRSRGAQATDIVILVVAADDSVMPQTIEAINHAKAAGVPIVVAINKIDKEGVNPDKIKTQLSEHDVIVEEYGGKVQYAEVSAHTGQGIEDLLEKVLIEAELLELKANPDRRADGVVLEARLDKGKGIVSNILVQGGTLRVGDPFVAGPCFGRVRAMENDRGQRVKEAGPSTPVQLMGFDEMPQAGDKLIAAEDEKLAKEVANERMQIRREQAMRTTKHMTLDDISRRLALGEVSELNIIIKADVDGSIEALSGSLQKLSTDEVAVNIIHTGAGAISESDVLLASASDAIIIGFQVRPTTSARKLAENEEIDIRLFSVIYDAVDEVRDALEGLLSPEIKEQMMGVVDVRETFKVSKVGTIAGCYVTEGKIERNNPIRLVRDGVVIYDGEIDALKRFKDDVKEVTSGYECGISIQGYNDIKVGDQIESYKITEQKRTLEDSAG